MSFSSRPTVGVVADVRAVDGQNFHMAQGKYLRAVWDAAGAFPVVLPAFGDALDLAEIVAGLDGLLLTGCVSNIEPWRYGGPAEPPCQPYDPARDATVLPLIPVALAAALPILAVCRGFQELNVALGGTLDPWLHERQGRLDHRAPHDEPLSVQYGPAHTVRLTPGGALSALTGDGEIAVNSLHWQGIDRLADGLAVEATAPDGTIEAISVTGAPGFALGVQWHPEWEVMKSPFSRALFQSFGDAARRRRGARTLA
jgi:putative glutamine amidotransferase